jgi:hypothetical protein
MPYASLVSFYLVVTGLGMRLHAYPGEGSVSISENVAFVRAPGNRLWLLSPGLKCVWLDALKPLKTAGISGLL